MAEDDDFLSRWSRRKAIARSGAPAPEAEAPQAPAPDSVVPTAAPTRLAPRTNPVATGPAPAANGATAAPDAPDAPDAPAANDPTAATAAATPGTGSDTGTAPPAPSAAPPPTLDDVAELTADADFSRFVRPDVDPGVRNAAMKKLFAAPEYNVMDGLDIYIDDYSLPSPMSASMLRKMAQNAFLGLVDPPVAAPATRAPSPALAGASATASEPPTPPTAEGVRAAAPPDDTASPPAHEDTDLRLQPHDAPGPDSAEPGAGPGAGRER